MRGLKRNETTFWYAKYTGLTTDVVDGLHTGEYTAEYSTPVEVKANVSYAGSASALSTQGYVNPNEFGESWNYDRYIVIARTDIDIDETSIVWIDNNPTIVDGKATVPHDYIVKRVGRSINSTRVVVRRVVVS